MSGRDDLPEGVDTAKPGDLVEDGAVGLAGTAPAPTGLRVTSSSDDSVTLSWTAVTDAHGYKLEYRESDDTTWRHGNYTGSSTSGTSSV